MPARGSQNYLWLVFFVKSQAPGASSAQNMNSCGQGVPMLTEFSLQASHWVYTSRIR